MIGRAAEILAPAGGFALPLLLLAAATFSLAAWCFLALRPAGVGPREALRVRALLPFLGALCSAGPLLGLLGTVRGLASTFRSFDDAGVIAVARSEVGLDGLDQTLHQPATGLPGELEPSHGQTLLPGHRRDLPRELGLADAALALHAAEHRLPRTVQPGPQARQLRRSASKPGLGRWGAKPRQVQRDLWGGAREEGTWVGGSA